MEVINDRSVETTRSEMVQMLASGVHARWALGRDGVGRMYSVSATGKMISLVVDRLVGDRNLKVIGTRDSGLGTGAALSHDAGRAVTVGTSSGRRARGSN